MAKFTDQEKEIISQFIATSLQQQQQNLGFLVDTFIGLLESDQPTKDMIKAQLSQYVAGNMQFAQDKLNNIDAEKAQETIDLNEQINLYTSLKDKVGQL